MANYSIWLARLFGCIVSVSLLFRQAKSASSNLKALNMKLGCSSPKVHIYFSLSLQKTHTESLLMVIDLSVTVGGGEIQRTGD